MEDTLRVQTKYNENLADGKVVVVTLLSNNNRTWDFIVDADAYHTLRLNEDYLVTTQDDWLGTIVGIRFETVANAINLKATVLKPVPVYDDQAEVLDETEDDTPAAFGFVMEFAAKHDDDDQVEVLDLTEDEFIGEDEMREMCEKDIGLHRYLVANMEDKTLKLKSQSIEDTEEDHQHTGVKRRSGRYPWESEKKYLQPDVEYKWLMEDTSYPLKAIRYLWEYKYNGETSNVVNVQNSMCDLLVLKRFAEDKLRELSGLTNEEVDAYNKFHKNRKSN